MNLGFYRNLGLCVDLGLCWFCIEGNLYMNLGLCEFRIVCEFGIVSIWCFTMNLGLHMNLG